MACKYKLNGVELTEQEFNNTISNAIDVLNKQRNALPENITGQHVADMISNLNINEINEQSLRDLNELNQQLGEEFDVDREFVTMDDEGNLEINQQLIDELDNHMDDIEHMSPDMIEQEMLEMMFNTPNERTGFSNDPPQASRFENMLIYKQSLISRLEKLDRELEASKSTVAHTSIKYDAILKHQRDVRERLNGVGYEGDANYVPGLKRELKTLKNESNIDELNNYMYSDIKRLDALVKSDDINNINEAKKILNFFTSLTTTMPDKLPSDFENQVFTEQELSNPALQASIQRMAKVGFSVLQKYREVVNGLEISRIEKELKGDPYLQSIIAPMRQMIVDQRLAQGKSGDVSDYNVFFGQQMKDINVWDKYLSDGVIGTFSTFGEITQKASEIFHDHLREFEGRAAEFEQRSKELVPKVNAKLNALGFGIKLFGKFKVIGTTYKIYKQKTSDNKYTGHLINRRSAEFMDLWSDIADSFASTFNAGNTGTESTISNNLINAAYRKRAGELRKVSIMIDPRKVSEIKNNSEFAEFSGYFMDDNGQHEQDLITNLGSQKGYDEEVAVAVENIRKYKVDYSRRLQDQLDEEGVTSYNDLSDAGKREMIKYFNENNPFIAAEYFYTGNLRNLSHNPNITSYGNFIPKRFKNNEILNTARAVGEEIKYNQSTEETGFYDKDWHTIESDDDLHDFWKLATEVHDQKKYLPLQQQRDLAYNMLPTKKASFHDILIDPDHLAAEKLSKAYYNISNKFKSGLTAQKGSVATNNEITDTITKNEEGDVALGLINTTGNEIRNNFRRSYIAFIQTLKETYDQQFKDETGENYFMNKHSKITYDALSQQSKEILSDMLGVNGNDIDLMKALNIKTDKDEFNIGRILHREVVNNVIENETFNLPQTLNLYNNAVALYAGRNAAMPLIDVFRKHFKMIANPNVNNVGDQKQTNTENGRVRANELFDRWFDKEVLGRLHGEVAGMATKKIYAELKEKNTQKGKWISDIYLSSLTHDEKIIVKELNNMIDHEMQKPEAERNNVLIESLEKSKENIGRYFAISAFGNRLLDVVRIVGLGLNPVAAWFNFVQGKTSNLTNGSSGLWMKEESIIRAENICMGSHIKLTGLGKVTKFFGLTDHIAPKSAMIVAMMTQRFKVFQDSSDEIYKSSIDTAVTDPTIGNIYMLNSMVEYVNQTPILTALLIDQEITGKDGVVSNVWDALMGGDKIGQLAENFRTPENIETWEKAESHEANLFETKVSTTIADFQGDYRRFGGSVYSNDMTLKMLMMFKRWIPRYVHVRLGVRQNDRQLNRVTQGRYRALSAASGSAMFGIVAITAFGLNPVAIGIGAVLGGLGSHIWGVRKSTFEGNAPTRYFKELAVNVTQIAVNSILLPAQAIATVTTGKKITNSSLLGGKDSKFNKFINNTHREDSLDDGGMKSNLTEISLIVMTTMVKLIIRGMTKDKDKDEDKALVNLLLNMCGRTLSDMTVFLDPTSLIGTLSGVAALRMSQNLIKLGDAMTQYDAIETSGPHIGENKAMETFRKTFAPGLLRKNFGLNSYLEKDMFKGKIDNIGLVTSEQDKMKKIIEQSKAKYRATLIKKYKDEVTPEKIKVKAAALIESNKKARIKDSTIDELSESKSLRMAKRILEENAVKRANTKATAVIPGITRRNKKLQRTGLQESIDAKVKKATDKEAENDTKKGLKK